MEIVLKVTPAGAAGSAAGTATSDFAVWGWLDYEIITYASQPSTTDVTVAETGGPARTLLNLANGNTNKAAYPRVQATDNTGTAISGAYERQYINGQKLVLTVAQGDPVADGVIVRIGIIEGGMNAA